MKISIPWERKNLVLLRELIKTDFKLRYQGSLLGYLWAVIRPLLMFSILYIVFSKILRMGSNIPHYPVYLLTGTVLWSFFTECTNQGIQSIVQRGDLIRKISFPKYIIVIAATATALINLLINLGVVLLFTLLSGVSPEWQWLLLPVFIFELYLFALALALLLGAVNVRFRDIASIWEVLTQALFYTVPIIYPMSLVLEANQFFAKLMLLNPIAQIIQDVRYFLITHQTVTLWQLNQKWWIRIIPFTIILLLFSLASWYFSRHAKKFAEEV